MIRVALLDDHPAVRAGVEAMLAPEPDLLSVGSAADEEELWPLLRRARPSVVVLDVHHPGRDGLALCLEVKRSLNAPAVVLYSASTPRGLCVAATLAGADAVVAKSSPARALLEAIRDVAREPRRLPSIPRQLRVEAAARLDPADHAILAMGLAGESPADIGVTLGRSARSIAERIAAIVATLAPADGPGERRTGSFSPDRHRMPAWSAA
jgi:DNA-binding NarL/FixJ family response regulator